ncbi:MULTISPECIES: hypothetical protein [Novilysobacter]|uniref:hypothetical protein n=1 Tax=Novilysobacter TaxID=3382699 RepID=UPI002EDAF009
MAAKHEAQQTTDHKEIRRWVEAREGRPATVKGTEDEDDGAGLLRIAFRDDVSLQAIGWDEFFEKFEDEDLAFLYQEETKDGKRSRFFKFVERE